MIRCMKHVTNSTHLFSGSPAIIELAQFALEITAMDTLLSVDEAARRLGGLSKYTIHAWLSSGKLRRTKVGSRTMIRESDLAKFVDRCNQDPGNHKGPNISEGVR